MVKSGGVKRENYLGWGDYFMGLAVMSAMRSKDPKKQVGACIVNEKKRIVGLGYNGFPDDCHDDKFPWTKPEKHLYVCHAELNAIVNKYSANLEGCTMYVTLFPCNEFTKLIIQSGIKKVWYLSDKDVEKKTNLAAKEMFSTAKIDFQQFKSIMNPIIIDFAKI